MIYYSQQRTLGHAFPDMSGPFTLSPMGQSGDSIYLNITMNDDDADLSGQTKRVAMAGTYVMDVTAKVFNNPGVKHTIRLKASSRGSEGCSGRTGWNKRFRRLFQVAVRHFRYL